MLEAVWSNCNDPVDGVRRQAIELFEALLPLAAQGATAFIENVAASVIAKDWRLKGRYVLLAVLCRHIDPARLFAQHPALQDEMFRAVAISMLDQVVFDVYAAAIDRLRATPGDETATWAQDWQQPLSNALNTGCSATMQQLSMYWFVSIDSALLHKFFHFRLPYTFKVVPGAFQCLFDDMSHSAPTAALIAMLEAARGAGLAPRNTASSDIYMSVVQRAISHEDESVAIAALRFVTMYDAQLQSVRSIPFQVQQAH